MRGIFVYAFAFLFSQLFSQHSLGSISQTGSNLDILDWHFTTLTFNTGGYVYTPFFVDNNSLTFYSPIGSNNQNSVYKFTTNLMSQNTSSAEVIGSGINGNYDYFRAARVARAGSEYWMVVENAGCYSGCANQSYPQRLAVYHSLDSGNSWRFVDFLSVDGSLFVAGWWAHTGLIFNPSGSSEINLNDLTKNRFITLGENKNIFVSADGVHYKSVAMKQPFSRDRLTFASIAKTPYGFHLMTCANWSDNYYTTTVRHLFSKDLVNWVPLESSSSLKNPNFYKGVHLSYDEKSNKLWALSVCGDDCGFLAWLTPKDYTKETSVEGKLSVGEFVQYKGRTAMIISESNESFKIRFYNGTIDSGFTKEMFSIPLAGYNRQGCAQGEGELCIGYAVNANGYTASIVGFRYIENNQVKYAIKFTNGQIDTGYLRDMLTLL